MNIFATLFLGTVLIWLCILTYFFYKFFFRYKKILYLNDKRNLIEIVNAMQKEQGVSQEDINRIKEEIGQIEKKSINYIKEVNILRFNPFADTGGIQSYVIALLDSSKTGAVITSLHTRGSVRWYVKKVKDGKGTDMELSKEEQEAIG